MKSKFSYIVSALTLITAFSCSDFLDIKPLDKMVLEDYWKTKADVESTILACYRAMLEDGFMERIVLGGELRSDNVVADASKLETPDEIVQINDMNIKPANSILKWQDFYRVINYCNAILEFAPQVTEIDPNYTTGYMRRHLAEAYTIRALTYFYLVRIYRDVPFIKTHYKEDTQNFIVPQTPGDEILRSLIEDLETAEKYAMEAWGFNGEEYIWQKGRVTKNTVRIILADIYLWLGEYDKCIAACEKIEPYVLAENEFIDIDNATGAELRLMSNTYFIINSFSTVFMDGNSMESLFELQFSVRTSANAALKDLYYRSATQIGEIAAASLSAYTLSFDNSELLFNEKDIRGLIAFRPQTNASGGGANTFSKIGKYFNIYLEQGNSFLSYNKNIETNPPNWILYRLADVYLIKAEALVERNAEGDLDKALELVNITYLRSCPDVSALSRENYNSQDLMRKLVFNERQREFLFEGKRWFDMLRMALREDRKNGKNSHPEMLTYATRKYSYNGDVIRSKLVHTDALYLPIHRDELINNPALKQNPYYEVNMGK